MLYQTTQEHEELRAKVREFAEAEVKPIAFMLDKNNQFPAEQVKKMGELGLMGLPYEKEYGGAGSDALSRPCEELYLSDLILALGAPLLINRCQNPDYRCENRPEGGCGLCRELSRIQEVLDGEFRKTPLSAIFQET